MSEYDYDKLGQGQEVLATKKTQESTIAFLSQVPGKGKSTGYPLTIDFDGNNFMDGRNVMIYVPQQQICLPKDSVINNSVYVIDSRGRVHKQKNWWQFCRWEQGVQSGERIVANPDKRLKDGKRADRYDLENLNEFYRQGATQLLINLWKKTELHGVI